MIQNMTVTITYNFGTKIEVVIIYLYQKKSVKTNEIVKKVIGGLLVWLGKILGGRGVYYREGAGRLQE